jgi:phospholipase A1
MNGCSSRKRFSSKLSGVALFLAMLFGLVFPCSASTEPEQGVRYRLAMEAAAVDNPFLLLPHHPNYIFPFSYSLEPNNEVLGLSEGDLKKVEIFFQVSLKLMISENFLGTEGDLYAAYTNRSWWQAYNAERSSPFRETNHEPELFWLFDTDWTLPGFDNSTTVLGVSHQSNGQGGDLSRSWNRIYLNLLLERRNTILSFKPWYRIPERDKESPDDPGGDDNPDINHYMGCWELGLLAVRGKSNFTVLLRNNLRQDNRGAVQLGWSYPLSGKVKGYMQLFDGYGDSLIDYDHRTTRLGVGFLLADWL